MRWQTWRTWAKPPQTRMGLLAFITLSFAVLSVLTVQELDKQREASRYEGLAARYALLLDKKIAQAEAEIYQQRANKSTATNAQSLVQQQPWIVRLEERNSAGDLVWSHVFTEEGAHQPLALPSAVVLPMQEGAARAGRPHYSALQMTALTRSEGDKEARIHVAWPLDTADHFGFASWSVPKLLEAANREAVASLGVNAAWAGFTNSQLAQEQWVRLGSTGVMLPLMLTTTVPITIGAWQAYALPVMTVLLVLTLGFLYRENYLRQRAEALTREQQERVQASARLATLGEIATMISHEINQPLAAIETYAATCERMLAQNKAAEGTLQQALSGVRAQAERAGRIIRSVQDFAQSRKEATQAVDVMEVIRELSTLIDIQAKRFNAIVKVQGLTGVRVQTNKTMIEQVLLNLVRNGLEAMRDTPEERRLLELTVTRKDTWLVIAVTDHGCGVAPEIRERLCLPFITKAQGTGVGLSLCKSLVEKYRGQITYADILSGGSVFTVSLPLNHAV
jgi:signal transduction histidine kinase